MGKTSKLDRKESGISQWNSYFDIDDRTVHISGSNLTGYEYVYVDEELVSKKLNWTFKSSHKISIDNVIYQISIELLSVLQPQIKISVCKEGALVDEDYIFNQAHKNSWKPFAIGMFCGGIAMYLSYKLVSSLIGG